MLRRCAVSGSPSCVVLAGCSSGDPRPSKPPTARPALTGAQAHAGASGTSGALTQIPDTDATRVRLGYVAVEALGAGRAARQRARRHAPRPGRGRRRAPRQRRDHGDPGRHRRHRAARRRGRRLDGVPSGEDGVVIGAGGAGAGGPRPGDERDHARRAERGAVVPRRHAGADDPRPGDDGRRRGARRRAGRERRRARGHPAAALRRAEVHPPHPRDGEAARSAASATWTR